MEKGRASEAASVVRLLPPGLSERVLTASSATLTHFFSWALGNNMNKFALWPLVVVLGQCVMIPILLAGVERDKRDPLERAWRYGRRGYPIIVSWPESSMVLRRVFNVGRCLKSGMWAHLRLTPSSRTKSPRALWHREGLCNEIMSRREE